MTSFIEKIMQINQLANDLLKSGKAKDAVEAQKMAEAALGANAEIADFNKNANATVQQFQSYGDRVRKNDMKQPKSDL